MQFPSHFTLGLAYVGKIAERSRFHIPDTVGGQVHILQGVEGTKSVFRDVLDVVEAQFDVANVSEFGQRLAGQRANSVVAQIHVLQAGEALEVEVDVGDGVVAEV